ncbi:type 1 glutamine amidotransferase [Nocardioides zeae]|uniref:Type 1 glutamine amidotransferase n=1 Tax=Nocardioides imazamoxiresistens TaxID=3231893 RepID=A0ABU3Q0P7_9ACTN|nr:type 1 glutamine amidotransferase [Nocardioides zeae]MDT9594934.1 type 1 glutamine amidotransferase [Nocardioides zeae]
MSGARLLVVQHQGDCPAALFGGWWVEAGLELDVRRADRGELAPGPDALLAGVAGLVVLGGSPGANDDDDAPWLPAARDLVAAAAARGVPTLGICLGHQLAAVALGGTVERNPAGQTVGLTPVAWTAAAAHDPLFADVVARRPEPVAVHWNSDVVTALPHGAVLLASTPGGDVQAARLAPTVWGVQLHPEADRGVVEAWAASDAVVHAERGLDQSALLGAVEAAHAELAATWRPLADAFARRVASGRTSEGDAA